ncbi:MAG: aminomethyl transferase family protein [Ignavibacteriae bacterium]|nr:aminomethyl transferase family protein [Ignavibacteriota bacterium]
MKEVEKYIESTFPQLELSSDELVKNYSTLEEELNVIKYGVGLHNRSHHNIIKLNGKDVLDLLQRISTNDVSVLEDFHHVNTLFTNDKGRLIDRTTLIKFADDFFLVTSFDNDNRLLRWIDKYVMTEDVKIENESGKYFLLEVIGPQAESYLTLICGKDVDELDHNKIHRVDVEGLKFHLLKKQSLTGEVIYWIVAETDGAEKIIEYLLSHRSVFDLAMIGEEALVHSKIENVVPTYPSEINDNYNPYEAGLIKEVSFTKGCYIGQEVIARLDTYKKVQRTLKNVKVTGLTNAKTPVEISNSSGEVIGVITTLVKMELENKYNCLCYLQNKYLASDQSEKLIEKKSSNNIEMVIK